MPAKKKAAEATVTSASAAQDIAMSEAPASQDAPGNINTADVEQKIRILPGSSEKAASYEFKKEDHTLGNALRYIIMKNPDVEFCGYSIPHPSEAVMNIRIQTYDGTAIDALSKGLDDLMDLCDIVTEKFAASKAEFMESRMEE